MNKNAIGFTFIIVVLVVTGFFSLNLFLRERSDRDKLDIRTFPYEIAGWRGKDLEITEKEYEILETRNLISREYINAANEPIYLFMIYSETNRSVFHPPEVCLIGSGITINNKGRESIDRGKNRFFINKLDLENKNNSKLISLYCYKAGNLYTDNFYLQQAQLALNQLIGKRAQGATIRASMTVTDSESETLAALKTFMKDTITILEFLPTR